MIPIVKILVALLVYVIALTVVAFVRWHIDRRREEARWNAIDTEVEFEGDEWEKDIYVDGKESERK